MTSSPTFLKMLWLYVVTISYATLLSSLSSTGVFSQTSTLFCTMFTFPWNISHMFFLRRVDCLHTVLRPSPLQRSIGSLTNAFPQIFLQYLFYNTLVVVHVTSLLPKLCSTDLLFLHQLQRRVERTFSATFCRVRKTQKTSVVTSPPDCWSALSTGLFPGPISTNTSFAFPLTSLGISSSIFLIAFSLTSWPRITSGSMLQQNLFLLLNSMNTAFLVFSDGRTNSSCT